MPFVFITGAAQGIGYATARRFAKAGWFVGLFDVNRAQCTDHAASADFPKAIGGYCDVTSRESVAAALAEFSAASGGRMDVLINNAGVLSAGDFAGMSLDQLDAMVDVNVKGLTTVSRLAFPFLKATPGSVMVNLCSASSIHGIPLLAVYSATKFYVNGLTQALNIEWAEHDIHVTCIKPPPINTAMGHQLDPRHVSKMPIEMEPETVAAAIWQSVHRKPLHIIMGTNTKLWYWINKMLPTGAAKRVVMVLTGA